jgi:hypothetical protein
VGASTAAPGQAQWMIAPSLGVNVAGGVEQGEGGPGGSAGYLGGRLGFEFDVMRYQHSSRIPRCSPFDPAAPPNCTPAAGEGPAPCTDIDSDAISFMGNVCCPFAFKARRSGGPYRTAGLGVVRAWTNERDRHQNNFGLNAGGGVLYSLGQHVGLRADLRYFGSSLTRTH